MVSSVGGEIAPYYYDYCYDDDYYNNCYYDYYCYY